MKINAATVVPIPWWVAEPSRLERDKVEVTRAFPDLRLELPTDENATPLLSQLMPHGGWTGVLPRWPFDRPEPRGLVDLIGDTGLECEVHYSAAHPMVPPHVRPVHPQPEFWEHTQSRWHVLPDGGLCLLQSDGGWDPAASITELIQKAAGWRIEYALMKAELIEAMTTCGIVTDDSLDSLITASTALIADATREQVNE
jgi:hypothetical protein